MREQAVELGLQSLLGKSGREFLVGDCMHLALCDDHALVADGITLLLESLDPLARVTPYYSAKTLLAAAAGWTDVDLVLLDLALPDTSGLETLYQIRALREDVPVVVLSGHADRTTVLSVIDAGAMGFVPKAATTQTMLEALRIVLAHGVYVPDVALDQCNRCEANSAGPALTPRQWDVLHAVLKGQPVKRIARDLGISDSTVKTHVTAVLRELKVTTRTEAIVKAVQLGLDFSSRNRAC
jgi:DNA-binding NarL/FixJ family response regulator